MAVHQSVDAGVLTALRARPQSGNWRRTYAGVTAVTDVLSSAVATAAAAAVSREALPFAGYGTTVLPLLWVLLIFALGGYDQKLLVAGYRHLRLLVKAAMILALGVATASYVTGEVVARPFVLAGIPLALALSVSGRFVLGRWLARKQAKGHYEQRVLLVGEAASVAALAKEMRDNHLKGGWRVVGACVPGSDPTAVAELRRQGISVLGHPNDVAQAAARARTDVVAVAPGERMGGDAIRRVGWALEKTDIDVVVAPGLSEVSGQRLDVRPVGGLPLVRIAQPQLSGGARVVKSLFDRSAALVGILVLSPLLVAIALAVRLDSRGPAMFTQTRVGINGRPFRVFKFRTMVVDAEALREKIAAQNQHGVGPLFKMRADPRITRVGTRLRRWSLDELPQLLNIVRGDMSLVGPRPPLPGEVAEYEADTWRRMLVKPGLTGLWQVSGRSDLPWDESVRLDLRYVENWSLRYDLHILWRTARAVLTGAGAY